GRAVLWVPATGYICASTASMRETLLSPPGLVVNASLVVSDWAAACWTAASTAACRNATGSAERCHGRVRTAVGGLVVLTGGGGRVWLRGVSRNARATGACSLSGAGSCGCVSSTAATRASESRRLPAPLFLGC